MYIAGDCLARGYLHRPEITAARFIQHGGTILYKTGDLARYLSDGNLEYLGRSDQQIKIRGFRVRGIPMMIYRPSNIMGDTTSGICSPDSFVIKMIQGFTQVGLAPDIDAALNLVPVDYVSRAILHLSRTQSPNGQAFNVVNPQTYSWNKLVDWMGACQGYSLKRVSHETWCAEVINVIGQDQD
ncbi:SDR family oxidoreductase [Leptothoe spongobia]|uniref:SDR family oxidoreductase n=1 Tax=Leptothoe spongobia TaxID=2651728 RepID=UPI001FE604B4|nr:SDR family oxidoreductase [Leptothoe spongobia]